ncbi:aminoglycoside phosphotransferase family protein [Streptomyces sp. NPDC003717]|uniref:phosphotransferase family protein n=1 Tax=Streptomyces sp. NPDC003717 TaxID=3154276 RepID=UPI0033A78490
MSTELTAWAADFLPGTRVHDVRSRPGGTTTVARLTGPLGEDWFAKLHRDRRAYRREVTAYREWVPALGGGAPRLVTADDDAAVLVVSAVPGVLGVDARLDDDGLRAMHRRAGALLRAFHQAAPPMTGDFAALMAERHARWRPRAAHLLSAAELDFVRDSVACLAGLPEPDMVPCHRDYTARNWLVDGDALYVIDFEHAAVEARIWDLLRLYHQVWPDHPGLRDDFIEGYGRALSDTEHTLLRLCGAHHAMTTVVWARETGDAAFERTGRDVLARLRRPATDSG